MRMHKDMVIRAIRVEPHNVAELVPGYSSAADAILALEAHPGEWIVDGELLTPEQWGRVRDRYGDGADARQNRRVPREANN